MDGKDVDRRDNSTKYLDSRPGWVIALEVKVAGTDSQEPCMRLIQAFNSKDLLQIDVFPKEMPLMRINNYSPEMWIRPIPRLSSSFDIHNEDCIKLGFELVRTLIFSKKELVKNTCYTHGYLAGAAMSLIPLLWLNKEPGATKDTMAMLNKGTAVLNGTAFELTPVGLRFDKSLRHLRQLWHSEKLSSYQEKAIHVIDKKLFAAAWIGQGGAWSTDTMWQLLSICLNPTKVILPGNEGLFLDVVAAENNMLAIGDQIHDKKLRGRWPMPIVSDDADGSN